MFTQRLGRQKQFFTRAYYVAIISICACLSTLPDAARAAGLDEQIVFDIPAQPLESALLRFSQQASVQLLTSSDALPNAQSNEVSGRLVVRTALVTLLRGTGLTFALVKDGTIAIRPLDKASVGDAATSTAAAIRLVQADTVPRAPSADQPMKRIELDEVIVTIPEVLVVGSRSINADIQRTEDDPQPYVVFDRQRIEQSGATNLESFLRQRLTMNSQQGTSGQNAGNAAGGDRSQINLRGLGSNQTLILIDGRRTSNTVSLGSNLLQQDLNGIPLGAVERIEILPTTASGIYGGDATGGVINIVLRRDYEGAELTVGWDSSFDTDDSRRRVELSGGFNLEEGKTNVLIAAAWSDGNVLMQRDRDFVKEYRDQAFANRPTLWMPPVTAPLGSTTNIRSTGGNLVLDSGRALGASFTSVPVGYAGAASDGGNALADRAGQYNFDLAESVQGGRRALLNSPTVESAQVMVRRQFGAIVQAFLEASAFNNVGHFVNSGLGTSFTLPASAPNNPFQQEIQVTVPTVGHQSEFVARNTDRRLVGGVIGKLPWGWHGEVDYVWSRTSTRSLSGGFVRADASAAMNMALQTIADLNPLRDTNVYRLDFSPYLTEQVIGPFETTTKDVTLLAGGPVGRLPGGMPSLSLKLEHRKEMFGDGSFGNREGSASFTVFPGKSQSVTSAYAEVRLPVVSALNQLKWVEELEVQLSARRDDYEIEGSTNSVASTSTAPVVRAKNDLHSVNPTVGIKWKPLSDVVVRASFGTGFLPPSVSQLAPNAALGTISGTLTDPRRGGLPIGANIPNARRSGGNPDLEPEESESWSAGIILTPKWVPGLRLSVDYVRIKRNDRISSIHPFGDQGLINDETLFPDRIVRGTPTAAEAALGWAGPITLLDATSLNIALANTEAYDLQLDYQWETEEWGTVDFYAMVTRETHNLTQTKDGQPIIDNVGFSPGVLEYKANAGTTWNRNDWTVGWNARYCDAYRPYGAAFTATDADNSIMVQGSSRVSHQIYHDVFATYRVSWGGPMLDGTELTLGVRNVFNAKPPRELQSYSAYGDPRLASYYLTLRKQF